MNIHQSNISDDSSSSSSDSSSFISESTDGRSANRGGKNRVRPGRESGFVSLIDDWMGDERSLISAIEEEPKKRTEAKKHAFFNTFEKKKIVPKSSSFHSTDNNNKIAQKSSISSSAATLQTSNINMEQQQRCYLVSGTQIAGTLIEHYSKESIDEYLAVWTAPDGKNIPKFKFTQNWGKNEIINFTKGDLRGINGYFSGICQWLKKAKTFSGTVQFCNHVPGWECDIYFYFLEPVGGVQTILMKDGEEFPVSAADAVAIIPRGKDFLHYDPKFQCSLGKWVSEGSKLGFATKLDVRAGSAYPENSIATGSHAAKANKPQAAKEEVEEKKEEKSESRMVEGATVYVRDPHYSWLPATIDSDEDDKKRVKVQVRLPNSWGDQTVAATGRGAQNMKMERLIKLTDYQNDELPLQNLEKDGVTTMGKNDMADLANLHEAAILYNLKTRHADSLPYTRVGDILVAVNPFEWIKGLYSEEKQDFYAKNLIWQAHGTGSDALFSPRSLKKAQRATAATEKKALGYDYEKLGINPHPYETSSLAYLGLAVDGNDQTILVTGESGAGKTETIKIVMNHLATVEKSRPSWPDSDRVVASGHGSDTVNRVLQSNPLFEAFGNAKTLRNDNSSRFGKFTQLKFDVESDDAAESAGRVIPSCHLVGSKCITYLLEKSRVVSVGQGERTFHIFYQLLGAPEEDRQQIWDGLVDASISDFTYLSNATPDCIDGLASPEHWPETVTALSVFGVEGDMFLNVMRSLCVILILGNISFGVEMQDGEERAVISSTKELETLSSLMGVPKDDIEAALTRRVMNTRGEEFTIFLKESDAKDGCDALAKEIYARVFDLLVTKCNESTEPKDSEINEYRTISLLDIFGFESFKVNRFEQLCINYANERLQQKYVTDNFQAIKQEYEEEGVNVFDFSLVDNTEVMELLEGKLGLITQLNEECVKKIGGDEQFVYKLKVVNSDSNRLIQDPLHRPYEFGIRHYAAPIKYDARMMMERNMDKIPADLMKCACASTNPLIREEFQQLAASLEESKTGGLKKRSAATKHFVFTKFRQQLTSLMSLIEESRTRYIRCVKPNKAMTPKMMDHAHTVSQLESAGLVTAIVISRESFPNRLSYELVMERFRFLAYKYEDCHLDSGDMKTDAEMLLNHLLAGLSADTHLGRVKMFSCGKTKVYFRAGALERIETIRQDYYAASAILLQAWFRALATRQRFLTLKQGMIRLQTESRCWLARQSFRRKVRSAVVLQCFIRQCLAKKELTSRRNNHAATVIQTKWRGIKPRRKFATFCRAATKLQGFQRMVKGKKELEKRKKERDETKAIETRFSVIQQTFDDATTVQGTVFSVDEGLLDEVETMFDFLRKEIVVLRKKNTKLKKDLAEAESDKREIFNHASSVDHAFALSKIRNEQMSKTNMALLDDNNKRRKEVSKLKNELKTQQQAHESQLQEMRSEFEMALRHREMEVRTMQQNLHSSAALHKREVQAVRDEAERKQEEHYSQISRLREEIKTTQDSHQDYLSKLMDVLETTQESRKAIKPPSEEMVMRRKDEEIMELKDEVARLRQNPEAEVDGDADERKKEAVKSMKYIVKKNRENRKARVQQLGAITSQLEDCLASGNVSQMQILIASMKETVNAGEKSNSKMDREMVNMIDNTASYYDPRDSASTADASLVAENQKLKKKLDKKYTCKKCGYKRKSDRSVGETGSVLEGFT